MVLLVVVLGLAGLGEAGGLGVASVLNQTSASVWSYHGDSVVWYFIEFSLPLM